MNEGIGHNSGDTLNVTAQGKLTGLVERIERLMEDREAVNTDMREVFMEAKGEGFDTKILRKIIAIRRQDTAKRQEELALIELYAAALGML